MAAPGRSLIDLPPRQAVLLIAFPAMGASLLRFTNHVVNQFWVGRLDHAADSLAAVTASSFLIWVIFAQTSLFATGLQALVARAVGARDTAAHALAIKHGVRLALGLGVLVAALGLAFRRQVLGFQDLSPAVQVLGARYLAVLFCGLPVSYVGVAFDTIYRAEGDAATPFRVGLLAVAANTVLNPFLIRGWHGWAGFGLTGAAMATVCVQTIQMLVLAGLHRRRSRAGEERPAAPFDWRHIGRLLQIGLPVTISGSLFSSVYIGLVKILAPFGSAPVAALGLGHTIEGFTHFVCLGFGAAAATLVGQNLGAGRPQAAEQAAWRVVRYLMVLLVPMALIYGTFAPQLLHLFMNPADPEVIHHGTQYLRMAAMVQVLGGLSLTLWQSLCGAGETVPTTMVDLVVLSLRIPLALLLARWCGLGPLGVWVSIGIMTAVGAVAMTVLFRMGRWKSRQL